MLIHVGVAAHAQPAPVRTDEDNARWWTDAVFYEVFVRSFADSTEGPLANDGIGDLRGLIDKLDYINDGDPDTHDDLGVTGIWLMPIMQSSSYHGYDTTDYYAVEDDYGTNEDFHELMEKAHARGIRVIVDLVLNHSSSQHPWFIDAQNRSSDYRDWYVWSQRKPSYKGPWGQRVWHESGRQWYYGAFSSGMPDLNFRNPAVTKEMLKVTKFWLEDMNADGFRLDAIKHLIEVGKQQEHTPPTHAWLRGFYSFYKRVDHNALAVGEVWTGSPEVAKYVGGEMDLAFEFDQAYAIMHASNTGEKTRLAKAQAASWKLFPQAQFATFLANHDMDRAGSQFGGDMGKAKLAATIQLTSPGVPFVYYGEEIGMSNVGGGDPGKRSPMQWSPDNLAGFSTTEPWHEIGDVASGVNVREQSADDASLLSLYRKLIRLRAEHPALGGGDFTEIKTDHPQVYAFLRRGGGEAVLVVVNLGGESVDQYGLALDGGRLSRVGRVEELLHGVEVAMPKRTAGPGAGGYQPIGVLEARTGYVLVLNPVER
jgi:alpha-amylase